MTPSCAEPRRGRVRILATGGTIAGVGASATDLTDYRGGSLGVEALLQGLPAMDGVQVAGEQFANLRSPDIGSSLWLPLARRCQSLLDDGEADGLVVTHGTDTLEETAWFLHLVLDTARPVVFTGAMRPATAVSADGPANLLNAVRLAACARACGHGVLVTLVDEIHGAREVAKCHTSSLGAFASPGWGPLGCFPGGSPRLYRQSTRRHTRSSEFRLDGINELPKVLLLHGHADVDRTLFDAALASGAQGIVYAGTGMGSVPSALEPALAEATRRGVVVVRASRTGGGVVLARTEHRQQRWASADNLSPQKARVLLQLALTRTHEPDEVQRIFDEY